MLHFKKFALKKNKVCLREEVQITKLPSLSPCLLHILN